MTIKKGLTVVIIIMVFIGSLYLVNRYDLASNLMVIPTLEMREPGVSMVLKGVRILEKRGDKMLSDIHASKMVINDAKMVIDLVKVESTLYNPGQPTVNIKSDLGYMDKNTNNLKLMGNVVVLSEDGGMLETDRLDWDAAKKVFTTDSEVTIKGSTFKLMGKEMESSLNPKNLKLDKDVHAIFY